MEKSFFTKVILIATCLSLVAGCIVERRPRPVVVAPPPVVAPSAEAVVEQPPSEPPPAQVEIVPESPGPAYIWVKGRYELRADNWMWVCGRWMIAPRPHAVWIAGHWEHHPHGFVWIGGHWR
ncbi:MAG TPA: hypothetical protein VK769_00320 [Verrucomicrobiae bacterium]|jgi:hypothetical protein|nr:hypothetical protein [Verrucomicrobiae bacterium]